MRQLLLEQLSGKISARLIDILIDVKNTGNSMKFEQHYLGIRVTGNHVQAELCALHYNYRYL